MMDWQTQRGLLQLMIAVCCALFAAGMATHSVRRDGHRWPLPWRCLVALWIASIGIYFMALGGLWLLPRWIHPPPDRDLTFPLYGVAIMTVWTFQRWVRVERERG